MTPASPGQHDPRSARMGAVTVKQQGGIYRGWAAPEAKSDLVMKMRMLWMRLQVAAHGRVPPALSGSNSCAVKARPSSGRTGRGEC